MSGRNSLSEKELEKPAARAARGSKVARLDTRASRQRAHLKGVEVTQEDIDRAMPKQSHSCMIADAIKRKWPQFTNVLVDIQTIRWTDPDKGRRVMCLTPMLAQSKLAAFDFGTMPAPFKMDLHSAQVTAVKVTAKKLGEDGQPVMRTVKDRRRKPDGTVVEITRKVAVREEIATPGGERELVNNDPRLRPGQTHVIGGKMPPTNRASRHRQFGMRAFTWADGENPEDIAARQQIAYGWSDEQMAAEGWKYAIERVAAKKAAEGPDNA